MWRRTGVLIAGVLVVSACGGGDTETNDTSVASVTPADSGAPDLVGASWRVEFLDIDGVMTGVWPDTEITLTFESAEAISGFWGCYDYTARYEVEGGYEPIEADGRDPSSGQTIRVSGIGVSEGPCEERVREQASDYFSALRQASRWVILGENLQLRTVDGSFLLEAEPVG